MEDGEEGPRFPCPVCHTEQPPTLLGVWGANVALRCRACGVDWFRPKEEFDEQL